MTDLPEGAPAPAAARLRLTWPETRDVIAILSTLGFLVAYGLPWFVPIPHGAEQNVGQMQGALILQWGAIMSWYFGSSKSAGVVREQLGKALDKLPDAQP